MVFGLGCFSCSARSASQPPEDPSPNVQWLIVTPADDCDPVDPFQEESRFGGTISDPVEDLGLLGEVCGDYERVSSEENSTGLWFRKIKCIVPRDRETLRPHVQDGTPGMRMPFAGDAAQKDANDVGLYWDGRSGRWILGRPEKNSVSSRHLDPLDGVKTLAAADKIGHGSAWHEDQNPWNSNWWRWILSEEGNDVRALSMKKVEKRRSVEAKSVAISAPNSRNHPSKQVSGEYLPIGGLFHGRPCYFQDPTPAVKYSIKAEGEELREMMIGAVEEAVAVDEELKQKTKSEQVNWNSISKLRKRFRPPPSSERKVDELPKLQLEDDMNVGDGHEDENEYTWVMQLGFSKVTMRFPFPGHVTFGSDDGQQEPSPEAAKRAAKRRHLEALQAKKQTPEDAGDKSKDPPAIEDVTTDGEAAKDADNLDVKWNRYETPKKEPAEVSGETGEETGQREEDGSTWMGNVFDRGASSVRIQAMWRGAVARVKVSKEKGFNMRARSMKSQYKPGVQSVGLSPMTPTAKDEFGSAHGDEDPHANLYLYWVPECACWAVSKILGCCDQSRWLACSSGCLWHVLHPWEVIDTGGSWVVIAFVPGFRPLREVMVCLPETLPPTPAQIQMELEKQRRRTIELEELAEKAKPPPPPPPVWPEPFYTPQAMPPTPPRQPSEDTTSDTETDTWPFPRPGKRQGTSKPLQRWKEVPEEVVECDDWLEIPADSEVAKSTSRPPPYFSEEISRLDRQKHLFELLDVDEDGCLSSAEMFRFATITGFPADGDWKSEYELFCTKCNCSPSSGITQEMFISLTDDTGEIGCYCEDEVIEEYCRDLAAERDRRAKEASVMVESDGLAADNPVVEDEVKCEPPSSPADAMKSDSQPLPTPEPENTKSVEFHLPIPSKS